MRRARRVVVPDLPPYGADCSVQFGFGWEDASHLWELVLTMSVRDAATSLHYHPWKSSGELWYVVDRVRYALVPPAPEMARRLALAAGAMLCGGFGAAVRQRLGRPLRAGGRVRVLSEFGDAEFAGVVWAVGGVFGVEWHRLDPPAEWDGVSPASSPRGRGVGWYGLVPPVTPDAQPRTAADPPGG